MFKQQLTNISTVLNNTGNTTKLLISFNALNKAQQDVLLSSKLLNAEQIKQCTTMQALSAANAKYTAEQLAKTTGVSAETLANWGLIKSTDTLTISELAEKAASDAQAKTVLEKIIAQNAQAVANGEVTASNTALTTSEGSATLATGAFTTAIKANISAMWTWMTTTPIGWLTMLVTGIFLAVKAYDALTDSVEETKEKADDLISTYKTVLDTANSHKESIDNIIDKYEELSKGVNNLGENVSLTSEEYQEYNSIVNNIAEMFPTMVQGYTDEGNAILKLKGNVDALKEAYEAEAQAAYNSLITTGKDADGNDILKNANNIITGSTLGAHDWGNLEKLNYLDKLMEASNNVESMLSLWEESLNSGYSKWFEDFADVGGMANISKLTDKDLAEIKKNVKVLIQQYKAEINSAVDDAELLANAYLMTNEDYAKLDEQSKNAASIMANSLNANIVSKFGTDKENIGKYIDDIVQLISKDSNVKDAMIALFTMDTSKMSVNDIEYWINKYIDTIANILKEDPTELKIRLGFDDSETQPLINNVKEKLKDEFDDKVGELTLEDLKIAAEKIEIPEGVTLSWEELIALIEKYKKELSDKPTTPLSITDTIEQLNTQLKPAFDALKSAYQDIFTDDGFTLENVDLSMLDDIKSKIDEINKNEELGIHIDYTEYENLARVLTDTSSLPDDVHKAFNAFATDIVGSMNPALAKMSGENYKLIQSMLESLGIINAEEVMVSSLGYSYAEYTAAINEFAEAKKDTAAAGRDLADMTDEEINGFIMEQAEAGKCVQALANLQMKKFLLNGTRLDTSDDIAQIYNLALVAGMGADVIAKLANGISILRAFENGAYVSDEELERVLKDIEDARKKMLDHRPVEIGFAPDGSKSGSKEKDTTKEFDWIEQSIENIEKEVKKLDDVVNSAYSTFSQKNEALAREMGKVTEEIGLQQQAYEAYMRKADSIGLSEEYKSLVRDGAINIENISDESLQKKISEYQQWYEKAVSVYDAVYELGEKLKDLHVKGYELNADRYEELLNSQSITEKQYLEEMGRLYREYYENQEGYAEKAHEAKLKLLEKEKSYLNSVANAAASLFDKEIDKINDNAKAQEKIYKDQIKAHEKQIKAYEDEIDLLNDRKKPLQDELDALEDKAREENLILDLQKKQYELKRAESQKDKLVYKDNQMVYDKDLQGIRDRKKEVDDAKLEIRKNDIQKRIDALDDEIEKYNELIDAVNDHIDGLNGMIDQINDAADAQTEALERLKDKWQEVIDQQEEAQNILLLTGEFGVNAINRILSGDETALSQWKQSYISTLGEIDMESQGYIGDMTEQLASLYNVDLSPLQAQFGNVRESVDGVTEALGIAASAIGGTSVSDGEGTNTGGESKPSDINSLESAILQETETAMGAFDQHTDKLTNEVVPAIQLAAQEMNVFNEAADRDINKVVTITYKTVGSGGSAHAEGTANVTGDWAVHKGGISLVGELGRELIVRNGKFFTVGENGAQMFPIQAGDIVFNNKQTEELLQNGHITSRGKAFTDGTLPHYVPLSPDDPALELRRKFDAYAEKVGGKIEDILMPVNAIQRHFEDLEKIVNNNMVYNMVNNNQPSMTVGDIHINCPGVTSNDVAKQVGKEVEKIFFGLNMKAYQRSMISR